jgi:hypothetical protein
MRGGFAALQGFAYLACAALFWGSAHGQEQKQQEQQQQQPQQQQEQQQQGQQQQYQGPPPYLDLRYDEDWTFLKQSKFPPDFFDPIKYIPFNERGWYTSFGGEVRMRYDNWHNANFGFAPAEWLNSNLQRYLFHNDTHLGPHVRVFAQLQSALEFGKKGGPWYSDKNTFEIHQAFVDLRTSADPKNYALLRVGRQEIALGSNHFVSTGDFFNSRHVFDGIQLIVGRGDWTFLAQGTKPVLVLEGAFDDEAEHGRTSWGAGFFAPNPLTPQGKTAGFYVALDSKRQFWNRGLGRDQRHTLGATINGTKNAWDYSYELLAQIGTFSPVQGGSDNIRAWAITTDTGYTIQKSKYYPRFGVRWNITSGDAGTGSLGTFHPLFPDTAYSGRMGLIGPSNVIDVTPNARFAITRRLYFIPEWSFFWRQKTTDGVYTPSLFTIPVETGITGFLIKPGNQSNARHIGNQLALAAHVIIDRHFSYTMSYNYFFAGKFLEETPPGLNSAFFVAWVTYKF